MEKRRVSWEHVYGHTGVHDNEVADKAADLGRLGRVSDMSRRWNRPAPVIENLGWKDTDFCKNVAKK